MIILSLLVCFLSNLQAAVVKVACVGNSITYGSGISNRDRDSYPSVLGQMLGEGYEVRNYGFSARTCLNKGDFPYMKEKMFQDALGYNPDIVIIKLGTNDTKPHNWVYKNEYKKDLTSMIRAFKTFATNPKIYLCYPAKAYAVQYGINDSIIVHDVIPYIDEVAKQTGCPVIDLHSVTSGMPENFPDKIHPNPVGAHTIAATVYKAIMGKPSAHQMQAFPGRKSEWMGVDRYDFQFNGRDVIVAVPKKVAKGSPWIWRPAFFGAFPSVDSALVTKGFHIVYYDLTHLYGSPRSVKLGTQFYDHMVKTYNLSPKVTLEGFSRGGLTAFNWAAQNPDKVACIYVDAPVCNLLSWPGRQQPDLWKDMLKEWNLTDEQMNTFSGNAIDQLTPIAKAGIPIFTVCGDSDVVVPYKDNMGVVREKYRAMGGPVELILKPGIGHHPHSLTDPTPVVDFVLRHQAGYAAYNHINVRGSMNNSLYCFEKERKGRVAFLGGSITEMNGWKDMIEEDLKQRFPDTQFEFVEAGIGSTGSTPGAFRMQNDVLSKGKIDLLFVEAAVNDHTNGFDYIAQTRGMEGEVRKALLSNPEMDIVMLHFIYDPFIELFKSGIRPDVVYNHERVANHYQIPSIDLQQEINERMRDGEFDWDTFGGTHPKPFGHRYYAAAINHLFDKMWKQAPESKQAHVLPQMLDPFSYSEGQFIDIRKATLSGSWNYVENWKPSDNAGTRGGFVEVPMLEATQGGDKLTLDFKGKAIGIFCVAGPKAGVLEYSVDGAPMKSLDTHTAWSNGLYIPWVFMLETQLADSNHTLVLRIAKEANKESGRTACQIRNFVVNGQ